MSRKSCAVLGVVLLLCAAGCPAERAETEKLRAELAEARAEIKSLRDQQPAYQRGVDTLVDQLERLEALKRKGALTEEEFLAQKRTLLATPAPRPAPAPAPQVKGPPPLKELDRQLRELNGLWNKSAINGTEYADAKANILKLQFRVESLSGDLDKVYTLWNQSILNSNEYAGLKQRVLQQLPTGRRTLEELEGQLREAQGLWNRSVLNGTEYSEAKAKLLQQPLRGASLSADLGRVSALWNQSILNGNEYNDLKQRVLKLDVGK